MKLKQICPTLLFLAISIVSAASQSPAKVGQKSGISAEIKDKAVVFLRQTAKEARTLSLPENRVALTLAFGELLWQYDEREARAAYESSITDMRLLLGQLRQLANTPDEESDNWQRGSSYELFSSAKQLRTTLILNLAEHDADAAENFYRETHAFITAPAATGEDRMKTIFSETEETQLETKLATVVSKNDPTRALKFAQEKLAKGVSSEIVELAVRLHSKDAEKGAKLAADILRKLKTAKLGTDYQTRAVAFEFLKKAAASLEEAKKVGGKTPLLSESDVRELAEAIVKNSLLENFEMYGDYNYRQNLELLTKFAPASAAQLQRKLDAPAQTKGVQIATALDDDAPTAAQATKQAEAQRKYEQRAKETETRRQELQSFQERAASPNGKVTLEEARGQIAKIKKPEERMMATIGISLALVARGDKKTAKDLLDETRSRLVAQPKFAADMLAHLLVAHAYVSVDPPIAFEMLEGLVFQSNDLVAAMIKLGEFALGNSAIENNEIRFGGVGQFFLGMVMGITSERGGAFGNQFGDFQSDFAKLAVADFDRLQALTNKFDRTELRLIARILVLQSLLREDVAKESASPVSD
jgi:hypothetical protein